MDDLLRRLDPPDEEDEAYPRIVRSYSSVEGPNDAERLRLELELVFPYRDSSEVWSITCEGPRRWLLGSEDFEPVALEREHPLLWEHTKDTCQLFFKGRPTHELPLVGALYQRHHDIAGDWIPFPRCFNASGIKLPALLAGGHGLLAEGPTPLMEAYAAVLSEHEVRAKMLDPRPPQRLEVRGDAHTWVKEDRDLIVLTLGDSFVVAKSFAATRP